MRFLSELLRNHYGNGWARLGSDIEVEALVNALETALEPCLAASRSVLAPSIAIRAEELIVAWLSARRMEDVLRNEGVCRMQEDNGPVFKEIHPMVEKSMKARERVRKALQELEEACKATAASGGTGALGEEIGPLLRLGDGVLDDALACEKRRQKRAPSCSGAARSRASKACS